MLIILRCPLRIFYIHPRDVLSRHHMDKRNICGQCEENYVVGTAKLVVHFMSFLDEQRTYLEYPILTLDKLYEHEITVNTMQIHIKS